jgi:hypothetical protein
MSVTYLEEWRKRQELISASQPNSQSKQTMPWDELGVTRTESIDFNDDVEQLISFWIILDKAAREPFTVKSNFARTGAWYVAVCASVGLITTQIEEDIFGKKWLITEEGFEFMESIDERIKEFL